MAKATVNLQDSFLNQVRKDNSEIEMVLVNGTHLTGLVRGFDNFTVVVNAAGKQHLVYKHAIAQIVSQRPIQDAGMQPAQSQQQGQQPPRERVERDRDRDRDRERRPQQHQQQQQQQAPRGGERPAPREVGPEREQQAPRPPKQEQQSQQQRDKFNVLDLRDVKLGQENQ